MFAMQGQQHIRVEQVVAHGREGAIRATGHRAGVFRLFLELHDPPLRIGRDHAEAGRILQRHRQRRHGDVSLALAVVRPPSGHPREIRVPQAERSPLLSAFQEPGLPGGRIPDGYGSVTLRATAAFGEQALRLPDDAVEKELLDALMPGFSSAVDSVLGRGAGSASATPASLVGTWSGSILNEDRETPIELSIPEAGKARLKVRDRLVTVLNRPTPLGPMGFEAGTFRLLTRGQFDNPDAKRSDHVMMLECALENGRLLGVVTDGDLRRLMERDPDPLTRTAGEVMHRGGVCIRSDELATAALRLLEEKRITSLMVCDGDASVKGVLHIHDLWGVGLF